MKIKQLVSLLLLPLHHPGYSVTVPLEKKQCRETKALVLGAGTAGTTAAQTLSNRSIHDFLILEYNGVIGGRVAHTSFGSKPDGGSYTVELGANWIQGLVSPGGPENPIWTLSKKYQVENKFSNYSNISTYTQHGYRDYSGLFGAYEDGYAGLEQDAGRILSENLLDRSARSGFSLAGWTPRRDPIQQAVEWWEWDWDYAEAPEASSQEFAIANYNSSFYQWSEENNYVFDQQGYNKIIRGEAGTFLKPGDPRLLLKSTVTNVSYDDTDVVALTSDGSCYRAPYAICTFSLGVLQAALAGVAPVSFEPDFPHWKQVAITKFDMGIYTKIFLQFDPAQQFWDSNTQYFLYAHPTTRGYYPVWQSLSAPGFLPGSGIFFVTVVDDQSRRVEAQSDEQTKEEVLDVLRQMFGPENVPQPTAFMYPRWGLTDWAYGSYSNWPTGVTLKDHQNLRANVGRLFFAGEHTSSSYYGYLQGAYFEGRDVGNRVASCVKKPQRCLQEVHYDVLHGTTKASEYNMANGWDVSSFQTIGDV